MSAEVLFKVTAPDAAWDDAVADERQWQTDRLLTYLTGRSGEERTA